MDKAKFDQIFNGELGGWNPNMAGVGQCAQDPQELWQVVERLNALQPNRILEIGVKFGGTTRFWQHLAREMVVAIDTDLTQVNVDFSDRQVPLFIQGYSADPNVMAKAAEWTPYDFLWIDGGHTYEAVQSDWNNYARMVRPGGLVGMHDVKAPDTGPEMLVRQIRAEVGLRCEIFAGHKGTALFEIPEKIGNV